MIDRAALLVADIERLPSVLLDQATGPWDDLAMDDLIRKRSYRRIVFGSARVQPGMAGRITLSVFKDN